ncbi:hypothetical protein SHIRM173S_04740 [Streptomyces hirsutus]
MPYLTSAVVATEALLACADGGEVLASLASARRIGALAVPLHTAPGAFFPAARAADGVLHGELTGIADADAADVLLVPADDGGLYAVEADAVGVTVTGQTSLDLTRPLARVVLDGAPGHRVGDAGPAVRRALRAGAGLLASEQLGLAEWSLAETVRYLKDRRQFELAGGRFPGAQSTGSPSCWLEVVNLRAAARNAADALAADPAAAARPTPMRPSPSPSRRPMRAKSPCAPPRRRCNCTAASG